MIQREVSWNGSLRTNSARVPWKIGKSAGAPARAVMVVVSRWQSEDRQEVKHEAQCATLQHPVALMDIAGVPQAIPFYRLLEAGAKARPEGCSP